jgi:hypothetical protein
MAKMIIDTNNVCPVLEVKFNELVNKGNVRIWTLQSTGGVTKKQYYSRTQEPIANGLFMRKTRKIFPESLWPSNNTKSR